jgi:hypothetical protein
MPEFETTADSEIITIDGLTIAPAEADNLKGAVSFASSMREIPNILDLGEINFQQFVVHFYEDGNLVVRRADNTGGAINFTFSNADHLIATITSALGISIDRKKLRPSPRSVGDPGFMADGDIIEG